MKKITGYLATLDVLGFKDMLERDGYEERLELYLDTINGLVEPALPKSLRVRKKTTAGAEVIVFSDSIVLTSPGDTDEAFARIISDSASAFAALLGAGIPVRGAVAFGQYWRQRTGGSVFLAGRPVVEAYRRERAQKWVGIALCPSALQRHPALKFETKLTPPVSRKYLRMDLALRLQRAPKIPFQEPGSIVGELSGYAVVPMNAGDNISDAGRTLFEVLQSLDRLRSLAPTPEAQRKYDATQTWLRGIFKQVEPASDVKLTPRRIGDAVLSQTIGDLGGFFSKK